MTPQEVLKQYESLINRHQFEIVAPLIAPDAVFWFNDGSFTGVDAIRGAFERTWASLTDETYWLTNTRWIALGDATASCIYQFNWTATIDGREGSGTGRGTTVLVKRISDWLIMHEHLSGIPS